MTWMTYTALGAGILALAWSFFNHARIKYLSHVEQHHWYEIKKTEIVEPPEGTHVVFSVPPDTPKEIIWSLENRLAEVENLERKFIVTNIKMGFIKTKDGNLEVDYEERSDPARGREESSTKRPTKKRAPGAREARNNNDARSGD